MSSKIVISVIIPTKDRYEHLEACIESIISSYSNYPYNELIVIDSSKDEFIREKNKKLIKKIGGIYCYENRKGVSIARNAGIKKSSGGLLVFADDDFIVDKDWVMNLAKNYEDREVMSCTGRMLPYRDDKVSELYEKCMSFDRGEKRHMFTRRDISIIKLLKTLTLIGNTRLYDKTPVPWAVGYGFYSFRREVFDIVGYFDVNLGRGTPYIGGEDPDIFFRILKKGHKIVYEPNAIIYHNHRQKYEGILKDAYNGGASVKALTTKYIKEGDIYMLFIFFGTFFLLFFALIKASLSLDVDSRNMVKEEFRGFLKGFIYKSKENV